MSKTKSDAARVLLDQGWDIQEVMDVLELEKVKTVVVEKVVEKPALPHRSPWDERPWTRPKIWLSSDNGAAEALREVIEEHAKQQIRDGFSVSGQAGLNRVCKCGGKCQSSGGLGGYFRGPRII